MQIMMRTVDILLADPLYVRADPAAGRVRPVDLDAVSGHRADLMAGNVRIVRGQTLSLKNREFIEAARATGVPAWKIILRHIVPNLLGVVAVYATLLVPLMILSESFISFLGLGVQEPLTSWGALISEGPGPCVTAPSGSWPSRCFSSLHHAVCLLLRGRRLARRA
jgi:oligopeptide transport system permease protein